MAVFENCSRASLLDDRNTPELANYVYFSHISVCFRALNEQQCFLGKTNKNDF